MITSTSNETIKAIRKLRERKFRTETGLAYIEGAKLVIDALEQNGGVEKIIISASFASSENRIDSITRSNSSQIESMYVSDSVFQTLSTKENPQGIAAVIRQNWSPFESISKGFSGLWVGLWQVADPGNLGSIMRTIDAVGARGIVLIGNCTDPYDPGALRGSMGAIFANCLVKSDVDTFTNWVKKSGTPVIGTSDNGQSHYQEVKYPDHMILVMGSERQGLPSEIIEACRDVVRIPMTGISDSLNLAVATGIMLYEIKMQHNREGAE